MKTLQALLAACALSALPLYATDGSDLTYATGHGEVGIPDWQPPKLQGR